MVLPNLLRYTIAPTARSGSFIPPIKAHLAAHLPKPKQSSFASGRQTAKPRLEAKPLGGHACTKYRVSFEKATDTLRVDFWELREWNREGYVWKANDLDGFPLRIEWHGNHYMITLKNANR